MGEVVVRRSARSGDYVVIDDDLFDWMTAHEHSLNEEVGMAAKKAAKKAPAPAKKVGSVSGETAQTPEEKKVAKKAGKTKTVTLDRSYSFHGVTYGPSVEGVREEVEVPGDFPEVNEDGTIKHPAGSPAARNQEAARIANGGLVTTSAGGEPKGKAAKGRPAPKDEDEDEDELDENDDTNTVSGKSRNELEDMEKSDLVALAGSLDIDVERGDGGEGEPLVSDYVDALSVSAA